MYISSGYHLLLTSIFHSHQSVPQFQRRNEADVSHNGDEFSCFSLYMPIYGHLFHIWCYIAIYWPGDEKKKGGRVSQLVADIENKSKQESVHCVCFDNNRSPLGKLFPSLCQTIRTHGWLAATWHTRTEKSVSAGIVVLSGASSTQALCNDSHATLSVQMFHLKNAFERNETKTGI